MVEYYNDSPESIKTEENEDFEEKYNNEEFGQYIQTRFGKKYFPTPLINNANNKNEFKYINVESLPRISDTIYRQIEHLPDYDYINSLAFEMLIRTTEFHKLDTNNNLGYKEKSKAFNKLGVSLSEIHSYNLRKVAQYYDQNYKKDLLIHSYCDLKIKDIDNGLDNAINYYLNKKQIYVVTNHSKTNNGITLSIEYQIDKSVSYNKIDKTPSEYYIPVKFDYKNHQNQNQFSSIDGNIPLVALENNFLEFIKDDIPNITKGKIEFTYTRPLVRFKESSIMAVPLNLGLSKKALIDIVTKLKDEYDDGSLKTPMSYLYNRSYILEEWKKDATFKVSKKSIAEAFFVYDLYQAIDLDFELKKNELNILKDKEIKDLKVKVNKDIEDIKKDYKKFIDDLKNNKNLTTKQKVKNRNEIMHEQKTKTLNVKKDQNTSLKEIKNRYKKQMNIYHTENVVKELVYDHYISSHMCKQYLKFLRKYITNSKYKQLTIGTLQK